MIEPRKERRKGTDRKEGQAEPDQTKLPLIYWISENNIERGKHPLSRNLDLGHRGQRDNPSDIVGSTVDRGIDDQGLDTVSPGDQRPLIGHSHRARIESSNRERLAIGLSDLTDDSEKADEDSTKLPDSPTELHV